MSSTRPSFTETFPALTAIPGFRHGFVLRHPEIDVVTDRETALARLEASHDRELIALGLPRERLATAAQVHGALIAVCDAPSPSSYFYPDCDGIITATAGQGLGIYVADCGAVYLVDPVRRALGLVHSGKKGSELGIAGRAIGLMVERFGSRPGDLVVQVAPCIRPPDYEIDFAAQIEEDCLAAGVSPGNYHDCGTSTSGDLSCYYSYRIEQGQTGRHLAVAAWDVA